MCARRNTSLIYPQGRPHVSEIVEKGVCVLSLRLPSVPIRNAVTLASKKGMVGTDVCDDVSRIQIANLAVDSSFQPGATTRIAKVRPVDWADVIRRSLAVVLTEAGVARPSIDVFEVA
jgi:hypothetical protein